MAKIHPGSKESPLPATLEDAIEEILKLRSMLIRERQFLAKKVQDSELDKRALRGTIRKLNKEVLAWRKILAKVSKGQIPTAESVTGETCLPETDLVSCDSSGQG